ncbi:MAG: O-antigen ligase family protein [Planctomycetota bacterium]
MSSSSRRITSILIRSNSNFLIFGRVAMGAALIFTTLAEGSHPVWSWGSTLIFLAFPVIILSVQTFNRTTVSMTDRTPAFLALLLILGSLSLLFRPPLGASWTWGAMESLLILIGVIQFWGVSRMSVRRAYHVVFLYGCILAAALLATLYGALLLIQDGGGRLTGLFPNSNHYCSLAGMGLAALAGVSGRMYFNRDPGRRFLLTAAFALIALILVAGVFLSGSRGGAAAIVISAFIIYAPKLISKNNSRIRYIALAAIGLLVAQQLLFEFSGWWNRLDATGPAFNDRLNAAGAGLDLWLTEPVFGTGPGSFRYAFLRVQPDHGSGFWWHNSHCDYITFLSDWGIAGFIIAAIAGWYFIRRMTTFFRAAGESNHTAHDGDLSLFRAGLWLIAIPFVHSLVDFPLRDPCILWSVAAVAGALSSLSSVRLDEPVNLRHNRMATSLIISVALIAVLFAFLGIRSEAVAPGRFDFKNRTVESNIKPSQWLRAYEANPFDHRPLVVAVKYSLFGETQRADAIKCLPDDWFDVCVARCPYDPQSYYFSAVILHDAGDTAGALDRLRTAVSLAPGQPSLQLNVADMIMDIHYSSESLRDDTLFNEAVAVYRNELRRSPEKTAAIIGSLNRRGLPAQQWADIVPDEPLNQAHYASYLLSLNMIIEASQAFSPHRTKLSDEPWQRLDATLLMLTGQYDDAANALERYITGARDSKRRQRVIDADAIFRRAETRIAQSLRAATTLLAEYSDNPAVQARASDAKSQNDELLDYSVIFWTMMNDKLPSDTDIALRLGDILFRRQRYQEMLDIYSPLLNERLAKPDRVILFHRCAIARDFLGALGAATFDAESALALDNRNETIIRLLAQLYQKQNRIDKLRDLLPRWIALHNDKLPDEYPKDLQAVRKLVAAKD